MKNKIKYIISLFILMFICVSNVKAAYNEVSFSMGTDRVYNGIKFPVIIKIDNKKEDVSGILFNLKYDPDKLEALIDGNNYNSQTINEDSMSSMLLDENVNKVYAFNNDEGKLTYLSSLNSDTDNNITIWFKPKQFSVQKLKISVDDFELYTGDNYNVCDDYTVNYNLIVNSGLGISNVKITNKINKLYMGKTKKLVAAINPTDTELSKDIIWKSSNTKIATVENGIVTPHKPGIVTISAISSNGLIDTDTIIVTFGKMSFSSVTNIKEGNLLKWNTINEADEYYIYRKEGSGKYKKIATIKPNINSYIDKKVTNGVFYKYYIQAYKGKVVSPYKVSNIYRIKRNTITSLTNKVSKTIKVNYKKNTKVDGYQIQYSTDSKFKTSTKIKIKSYKTLVATIKKLKKNQIYYVRLRGYKTYDKVKYYSAWTSVKSIKIKK